jgi:dipeptidyl aminopeptidase/acylaminoacyl peptidase
MRALAGMMAALLVCAPPAWAQVAPLPVEAYGRLPAVSDAALSPDGSKLALARFENGRAQVQVIDIDRRAVVYAGAVGDRERLRGVGWADDGRVSFVASRAMRPGEVLPRDMYFEGAPRRVDYYRTGVIDLATRRTQVLSTNPDEPWADQGAELIAPLAGYPDTGMLIGRSIVAEDARVRNMGVFRVDLRTGRAREFTPRGVNADTIDIQLDEAGAVVTRSDSDQSSNRWRIFAYDGDTPRLLLENTSGTGDPLSIYGLLPDGRLAAIDEDANGEFFVVYAIDRNTGRSQLMFRREGYEIEGVITDPWTRRVVGAHWIEVEQKQHFFDPALQAIYEQARAASPAGASFKLISWSRDRSRVLIYREQGLDGGAYFIFTPADRRMLRIANRYPEIAAAPQGVRQSLTYRARDGQRIPAYLTLPGAGQARNLPLVLLVHGGPAARDTIDFDWWAAFLASRGYAVVQPNYRGSSGYGSTWQRAGHGQWGRLMQTDVDDAVDALARSGVADPRRVCIVGASYGGYAALAGATLTPDRYRCAASVAGVTDLSEFLRVRSNQSGGGDSMTSDYWRISIGDRQEDRNRIRAVSPANLADRVTIPILLIHGTDDTIVPIDQSRRMRSRLAAAGKDVRFVELSGDDHYLSDAETRIQMLRELETFLARNLGPAAPTSSAQ